MNYLAHLYLSDGTPEGVLGSMLGDFIDGGDIGTYKSGVQKGITLHRNVDLFTDCHPIFGRSKRRIHSRYRHLKGVMVDIFYDHFLARHWSDYAQVPLEEFSHQVYAILNTYNGSLPVRLKRALPFMQTHNWLVSYSRIENIDRALKGVARRLSKSTPLDEGVEELNRNYDLFEIDFREFFPQLVTYVSAASQP